MTSLFALLMAAMIGTADARPHHHKHYHHKPHVKHHAAAHHSHIHKPRKVRVFHHEGHKYYRHAGVVWRWVPGHWIGIRWVRGHWEFSYRI